MRKVIMMFALAMGIATANAQENVTVGENNGSEQPTFAKEVYPQKEADGDLYHGLTKKLTFDRMVPPHGLEVTYDKTVHVIFPAEVRYVDLGSPDLIAGKADGAENVIRVKATVRNFPNETNMSVITEDGSFYTFNVKYASEPLLLNVEMCDFIHDGEKVNRPNNAQEIYLKELGIQSKDETGVLRKYYEHLTDLSKAISEGVFSVFQMQKEINSLKKSLSEKGKREGVNQQLSLLKAKVADLQKGAELTPEERLALDASIKQVQEKKKLIAYAEQDLLIFEKILISTPFDASYEEKCQFGGMQFGLNQSETYRLFNELRIKTETEWNKIITQLKNNTIKAKEQLSSEIQTIISSEIYKKGIRIFEENKELKDLNTKIQEEEKTLAAIDMMQSKIDKILQQQNNSILQIINAHCSFKKSANQVSEQLSISYDGLDIHIDINFHKKDLQDFLETRLNQRGYERQGYLQELLNNYDDNNESNSNAFLKDLLTGDVLLKNGYDAQNVAVEFLSRNWYSLNYGITYQADTFANMSEGKQAFVILKLLLDFSDKRCPILIDQPEDSLDNRAIYNELVAYIKRKKRERQIILVTHNSNVVVSADAENVIVANQNGTDSPNWGGFKFQYIHGALENTKCKDKTDSQILSSQGIREHICDILEGGREAFKKREQKYGFRR